MPPTASSPFKFFILFLERHRIFKFFRPFRLAIFSMLLVDNDNLVHDDKFVKLNIQFMFTRVVATRRLYRGIAGKQKSGPNS